jgi:Mu-like prophage I protein
MLAAVPLAESSAAGGDEPRWIHVAYEGQWCGHPSGPFKLTRKVFEEMVRNMRTHPQFRLGAGGYGDRPVVQYDFDHASEMEPTKRSERGAPAQGWVLDLEIRNGAGGRAELFALSDVLEPARSYIRERKMRWVSIAAHLQASDHVTNAPIGAVISSIAFTNQPFLRGLEPLAASSQRWNHQQNARQSRTEHDMTIEIEHKALLSALRVNSTAEAAARVPVLLASEGEAASLKAQIDELQKKLSALTSEKVEGEVDGAMKELDLHASMRDALVLCRTHEPAKFTAMVEAMRASRGNVSGTRLSNLTAPLSAPPTGQPMQNLAIDDQGRVVHLNQGATAQRAPATGGKINLSGIVGPTLTARIINAVQERNPALSYDEAAEAALTIKHTNAFIDG